jgi:rhamnosyltransferase subunit B
MTPKTNILLFWMGTTGDALPFMGIASALARRGHHVTVFGNGHFQPLADKLHLPFVDLISKEQYQHRLKERSEALDLESLKVNSKYVLEDLRPVHQAILDHHIPGQTIVVSQSYLLGSRIAQEELGFPLVTTHLYPMLLRSAYGGPWWLPRWLIRLGYRLVDLIIDAALAKDVNQLRHERGLSSVSRLLHRWWNSPDLVLACFPDWLSPCQPDWPTSTRQVGFPDFNPEHGTSLSPATEVFLHVGDPPVVFAHSAAVKLIDRFVEESSAAARAIGRRALFLGIPEPPASSPGIHFSPAEPHRLLLPRSAAIVHHGGLGTAMSAIRAGIPQLFIPQMLDQPANARVFERLGVGRSIPWKKYRREPIAHLLHDLLDEPAVKSACHQYQQIALAATDACELAADAVDELIAARINTTKGTATSADPASHCHEHLSDENLAPESGTSAECGRYPGNAELLH